MLHEAAMMQTHPSVLAFLVGSDYWPDDRAAQIYVDALHSLDWPNPIIASASERGYPKILGLSGMTMLGPYDWVPPNYWYGDQVGAAFGFGSELGAGVGTPEIRSLKKFLSAEDLADLWTKPDKGLFHMSSNVSQFYDRSIYNEALYTRYGPPTSLDDYLLKAQIMDYEATRAQFEGFSALQSADHPATGA
jgi:exo-1,4-beta-D-glucosaminidase